MRKVGLLHRGLLVGLVVTCVAAACGDSSEPKEQSGLPAQTQSATTTEPQPQIGGALIFSDYAAAVGLDPLVGGTGAGMAMAAVYDTLMRYNAKSLTYEPQTAESLTPNT